MFINFILALAPLCIFLKISLFQPNVNEILNEFTTIFRLLNENLLNLSQISCKHAFVISIYIPIKKVNVNKFLLSVSIYVFGCLLTLSLCGKTINFCWYKKERQPIWVFLYFAIQILSNKFTTKIYYGLPTFYRYQSAILKFNICLGRRK